MSKDQETKYYAPNIFTKNHSVAPLRFNKEEVEDESKRFPLGKFPFRSVINMGSRSKLARKRSDEVWEGGGIVLNHPDFIENASDKLRCKQILTQHGVPTPEYILGEDLFIDRKGVKILTSKKLEELKYPVVAKLIKGKGGQGMKLINNPEDFKKWRKGKTANQLSKYFFEKVFQPDMRFQREYRFSVSPLLLGVGVSGIIHSRMGNIAMLRKKMRQEAVEKGNFGRNIALGNSFFTHVKDLRKRFGTKGGNRATPVSIDVRDGLEIAVRAVEVCDLDFGGVDMLFDSVSGKWTVLEINTAPALGTGEEDSFTFNAWKKALPVMLQEKNLLY
jgi:hypothetical protein